MTLIAGVVAGAMTLSAFTKSEPKNDRSTIVATGEMTDGCSFRVVSAIPSTSGTKVTITVSVEPTFTPTEDGTYTVVVKPEGKLNRGFCCSLFHDDRKHLVN